MTERNMKSTAATAAVTGPRGRAILALLVTSLAAATLGVALGIRKTTDSKREVAALKAAVAALRERQGLTFADRAEFEAAVAESVERFIARRRRAEIERRFARFAAAPPRRRAWKGENTSTAIRRRVLPSSSSAMWNAPIAGASTTR